MVYELHHKKKAMW